MMHFELKSNHLQKQRRLPPFARKQYAIGLSLTFIFVCLCFVCGAGASEAAPRISLGKLDVSSYDFETQAPIPLHGEWEFYWRQLLSPMGSHAPVNRRYVALPEQGLWQNIKQDGKHLPKYGYATYRLIVHFKPNEKGLAIKVPDIFSSSKIFINGKEVFQAGTPGKTSHTARSFYKTGIIHFVPQSGNNEILIQVANFKERRGGLNRSLVLGSNEAIGERFSKSLARDLLVFGALLVMGIYHLCIFGFRRKDTSPLWFGIFCLIIAFRTLLYGERVLFQMLPRVPWEFFNIMDHLSFYWGIPISVEYVRQMFIKDISTRLARTYQALGFVFSLFLVLPPQFFNSSVVVYELITGAAALYMLYAIIQALFHHREGALTTVIGITIFIVFGINEILHNAGIINTFNSLSLGLVLFLFSQSVLLANRFSKALTDSENLTRHLQDLNRSLRRFIPQEFFRLLQRDNVTEIRLGDHVQKQMGIMFSDIRKFTAQAEQMSSDQAFHFLNEYFGRIGIIIRKNGGFIDKYLGDGFMALFPGGPDDAVNAAVEIQQAVAAFNEQRLVQKLPPLVVGTGLNFGTLILGTVGEMDRMDTTVIADSVNLCSRLEGLTKVYGKGTIATREFLDLLKESKRLHWRHMGLTHIQGKSEPVEIAHIYDGLTTTEFKAYSANQAAFEEALALYQTGALAEAQIAFQAIANRHPEDPGSQTYLTRINLRLASKTSEGKDDCRQDTII